MAFNFAITTCIQSPTPNSKTHYPTLISSPSSVRIQMLIPADCYLLLASDPVLSSSDPCLMYLGMWSLGVGDTHFSSTSEPRVCPASLEFSRWLFDQGWVLAFWWLQCPYIVWDLVVPYWPLKGPLRQKRHVSEMTWMD